MFIPVCSVHEDGLINLRGDRLADPDGDDPLFSKNLFVHRSHSGAPTTHDRMAAYDARFLGAPAGEFEEEAGHTLIVTQQDDTKAILFYFPSDQHEVASVVCNEDDEFENN